MTAPGATTEAAGRGLSPAWILCLAFYYQGLLSVGERITGRLPNVWLFVALAGVIAVAGTGTLLPRMRPALLGPGVRGWWLLAAWAAASLLWTSNPDYGLDKLSVFLATSLLPAILAAGLAAGRPRWSLLVVGGMAFAAANAAFGEIQADARLSMELNNPIWIARACWIAASVALWAPRCPLLLRLAALPVLGYVALLTGSRGPVLSFVLAPLLAVAWDAASRREWVSASLVGRVGLLFVLVAVGAAAASALGRRADAEGSPVARVLTLVEPQRTAGRDLAVAERRALQRTALDNFRASPLWGVGLGGDAPRGTVSYPHNVALEIASELGVIGLAIWVAIVGAALNAARHDRTVLILFLQALLYAMTSGDLSGNQALVVLSGLAGATHAIAAERSAGVAADRPARPPVSARTARVGSRAIVTRGAHEAGR